MMKITALLLCGSLAIFTTQAFSVVSQTEAEDGATNDMEYIQGLPGTTRQNPNPLQIAQTIISILRAFNFVPSPSQILSIINFVRQLTSIIQQIRDQTLPIINAFNQISQALATIFRCEKNPSVLDRAVINILFGLLNPGFDLTPPSFPPSLIIVTPAPIPSETLSSQPSTPNYPSEFKTAPASTTA